MNSERGMQPSEGPWRSATSWLCPGEMKGCVVKAGDVELAHVLSRSVGSQDICAANARLMAAAPDMFEAIETTIRGLEGEFGPARARVNFPELYAATSKAVQS